MGPTLKRAVGEDVSAACDLAAMGNVIGDLFERVQLFRTGTTVVDVSRATQDGEGVVPWHPRGAES